MPNDLALAGCFIELFKNQTTHYSPVSQTQHTVNVNRKSKFSPLTFLTHIPACGLNVSVHVLTHK